MEAFKDWLGEVRREDAKAIWEALSRDFIVHHNEDTDMCDSRFCCCPRVLKSGDSPAQTELRWIQLEGILDMTKDEFMAKIDPENEDNW